MPFDSSYTPKSDGLVAQLMQQGAKSCDTSSEGAAGSAEGKKNPRSVTRGSFSRKVLKAKRNFKDAEKMDALLSAFTFDWYQITLPSSGGTGMLGDDETEEGHINHALAWAELNGLHFGQVGGGSNGYRAGMSLHDGPEGEAVAKIQCGSTTRIMPNLTITGGEGACEALAPSAQEYFEGARLSRADVKFDYSAEGLYDGLLGMSRMLTRSNAKMGSVQTIESDTGRTFYIGSPTSTVRLRVYEKDKERLARDKIEEADCDDNLVRVEFVFRPQSRSKEAFATLTPTEMLCSSVWAREWLSRFAEMIGVVDRPVKLGKTTVDREPRTTALEDSALHGAHQYGGVFARLAISHLVAAKFDGSYADAVLTEEEVEADAAMLFYHAIRDTEAAKRAMEREGVAEAETIQQRRRHRVSHMIKAASQHEAEATVAQVTMMRCAA